MISVLEVPLLIAAACLSCGAGVWGFYLLLVLKTPKKEEYLKSVKKALNNGLSYEQLPTISIVVRAHNEKAAIPRRIENIAALNYPKEKIELTVVDDCSTDGTACLARQMLTKLGLQGRIVKNDERLGANASLNRGVEESTGEFILTTDADVTTDSDALLNAVKIFRHLENVGAVTGTIVPISRDVTGAVLIEKSYRSFYDNMLTAESAVGSTFPGYSAFTLMKRSSFSPLSVQCGSTDGNISLAIIRKGLRYLSAPGICFYEPIEFKAPEQRRQKIRRASRLIQSTLANKDMLFESRYGSFGRIVFPLRFAMMIVCPSLLFVGACAMILASAFLSLKLALLLMSLPSILVYAGMKTSFAKLNLVSTFAVHQFYLLTGLVVSQRKTTVWKPAERESAKVERPMCSRCGDTGCWCSAKSWIARYLGQGGNPIFLNRMVDISIRNNVPLHFWIHRWNIGETEESAARSITRVLSPLLKYAKGKQKKGWLAFKTMLSAVNKIEAMPCT